MSGYWGDALLVLTELSPPVMLSALSAVALGWWVSRFTIGRERFPRAVALCLMFGLYGTTLGHIIGAARESQASHAISTLVTVVSGYFGYAISKELPPRLKAMIPAAVICFLISLMFSLMFAAKIRDMHVSEDLALERRVSMPSTGPAC